jgi:hypothetical protein
MFTTRGGNELSWEERDFYAPVCRGRFHAHSCLVAPLRRGIRYLPVMVLLGAVGWTFASLPCLLASSIGTILFVVDQSVQHLSIEEGT